MNVIGCMQVNVCFPPECEIPDNHCKAIIFSKIFFRAAVKIGLNFDI